MIVDLGATVPRDAGTERFIKLTHEGEDVKHIRPREFTGKLSILPLLMRLFREVMCSSGAEMQSRQSGTAACDGHGAPDV